MSAPLMLDLFSGREGASRAFRAAGWDVVRVEIDERFPAEHRDVRTFSWRGRPKPDFIWASPPCTEFSLAEPGRGRSRNGVGLNPDMRLLKESIRVIREAEPRFWVIENVRGACRYFEPILGRHRQAVGPFFLWGDFPMIHGVEAKGWKSRPGAVRFHDRAKDQASLASFRAEIPAGISEFLIEAMARELALPLGGAL